MMKYVLLDIWAYDSSTNECWYRWYPQSEIRFERDVRGYSTGNFVLRGTTYSVLVYGYLWDVYTGDDLTREQIIALVDHIIHERENGRSKHVLLNH